MRPSLQEFALSALKDRAPKLSAEAVAAIIRSPRFQQWADRVEIERPRGLIARWRRFFGHKQGLTPDQRRALEEAVQKATGRFGR